MRVDLTDNGPDPAPEPPAAEPIQTYSGLTGPSNLLARMADRPTWVVYGLVVPVSLISWLWLIYTAGQISAMGEGQSAMRDLAPVAGLPTITTDLGLSSYLLAMLAPANFATSLSISSVLLMFMVWIVMSVAMMLPSATPMLRTYADIADVAAKKKQHTVSILVLAAGYLLIWIGFSLAATLFQVGLITFGQANSHAAPITGIVGGLLLVCAGLYQFSSLKHACLVKCRNPFTIIFARWSTRRSDIFRLGLQQGLFCLGCCWALMLVMLSVGTMNIFWMGVLTLFTLIEKTSNGKMVSRGMGMVLLAWGLVLMLNSVSLTFL